ncbi:MAG TPA: GNAT family N-acetyltransferase [Gaiellaceae bacterium]|nr:GNAT family N-acetyltransferase [Gaiellaceae bacterium]
MIGVADSTADLARCVEIANAVDPESPVALAQLQGASDGTFLLHDAGGYAYVSRSSVPRSAYAMVRVAPGARGRGVGSALLAAARECTLELGADALWGRVRDEASLGFVARRGFREVSRDIVVAREVAPGEGELARGIVELRDDHQRGAYEVYVETLPEVLAPLPAEERPFEEWLEHESRDPAVAFVALDGDDVVGYARLHTCGVPHRLEHGMTAVRCSHRRRGIATALKRAQLKWAADHGYRELRTDMLEGNTAMRAVNVRLGYRELSPVLIVSGSAS